jgi:hypothetical protein
LGLVGQKLNALTIGGLQNGSGATLANPARLPALKSTVLASPLP